MKSEELKRLKEKLEKEVNNSPKLVLKKISSDSFYIVSKKVFNPSSLNMHIYNIKAKIELKDGQPDVSYKVSSPNILTPVVIAISIALMPAIFFMALINGTDVLIGVSLFYILIVALMWRAAVGQERRWRAEGLVEMERILESL